MPTQILPQTTLARNSHPAGQISRTFSTFEAPARRRQLIVGTGGAVTGCAFVSVNDWRPGNSTARSRMYSRPTGASLQRLQRVLKAKKLAPVFFFIHRDGPSVHFDLPAVRDA